MAKLPDGGVLSPTHPSLDVKRQQLEVRVSAAGASLPLLWVPWPGPGEAGKATARNDAITVHLELYLVGSSRFVLGVAPPLGERPPPLSPVVEV